METRSRSGKPPCEGSTAGSHAKTVSCTFQLNQIQRIPAVFSQCYVTCVGLPPAHQIRRKLICCTSLTLEVSCYIVIDTQIHVLVTSICFRLQAVTLYPLEELLRPETSMGCFLERFSLFLLVTCLPALCPSVFSTHRGMKILVRCHGKLS